VDGLVMVLLGGVQTLVRAIVGGVLFTWLQDLLARETEYWRALLGGKHAVAGAGFPGKAWSASLRRLLARSRRPVMSLLADAQPVEILWRRVRPSTMSRSTCLPVSCWP
jgi:hypothetical protein